MYSGKIAVPPGGGGIRKTEMKYIQSVPELADQIETVYSLMVMKVKNV
jgi:hypothetical protein